MARIVAGVLGAGLALSVAGGAASATPRHTSATGEVGAAAGATASRAGSNILRLWVPEFMGRGHGPYTDAELTAMAKRFSMIVTMPKKFTPKIALMKKANPALELSVYRNATFATGALPEATYAHTAAGERIHSLKWPTTYLMELDSPAWHKQIATTCTNMVAASKYDYCYLDVLGNGPLISGDYMSGVPVHADGRAWTANEWISYAAQISTSAATALGRPQYGNGLGTGERYFTARYASWPLVPPNKQVAAEGFARNARGDINLFLTEALWKQDVDMIVDAEARGKGMMTITKLWVPATEAQRNRWHEYTLATFLLGTGGRSMFCFLRSEDPTSVEMDHPYNTIDPGQPTTAYRKWQGVYRRDFTKALVLVNPTTTDRKVALPRSYRTLGGGTVQGTITVRPNTGRVLRVPGG
ncbi:putative glycoside hydrolase [Nostocoides veronense]|uniref:Uncharacterized protein n=1 Tax=Nostocoides veronense TaxID=330836 RepID=A0ABN2LMT8_9MICO